MSDISKLNESIRTTASTGIDTTLAIALAVNAQYVGDLPDQWESRAGSQARLELKRPYEGVTTCREAIRVLDGILRTDPLQPIPVSTFSIVKVFLFEDDLASLLPDWFPPEFETNEPLESVFEPDHWRACGHEGCVADATPGKITCVLLYMLVAEADSRKVSRTALYQGDNPGVVQKAE